MVTLFNAQIDSKQPSNFMDSPIIQIVHQNEHFATIIRRNFNPPGIHFLTDDDLSQQLAYMRHPAGKSITPHIHNQVKREVLYTQEVLLLKKGKLRVDFYDNQQDYIESYILEEGDVILLIQGGHGFQVLEEIEMIEVKQGPYAGDKDKSRFTSIDESQIKVVGEDN